MPGLEPASRVTNSEQVALDCRVKPGNDELVFWAMLGCKRMVRDWV